MFVVKNIVILQLEHQNTLHHINVSVHNSRSQTVLTKFQKAAADHITGGLRWSASEKTGVLIVKWMLINQR